MACRLRRYAARRAPDAGCPGAASSGRCRVVAPRDHNKPQRRARATVDGPAGDKCDLFAGGRSVETGVVPTHDLHRGDLRIDERAVALGAGVLAATALAALAD